MQNWLAFIDIRMEDKIILMLKLTTLSEKVTTKYEK